MIKINLLTGIRVPDRESKSYHDLPPGEYELERRGHHLYIKGTSYYASEVWWDEITDLLGEGDLVYINEPVPQEVLEKRQERLADNPNRFDRLSESFVLYYYTARWDDALNNLHISTDLWRALPQSGAEHQTSIRFHRLVWHHIMLSSMLGHMNDLEIQGKTIEVDHPETEDRYAMITEINNNMDRLRKENVGMLDTSTLDPFTEAKAAVTRDKDKIFENVK